VMSKIAETYSQQLHCEVLSGGMIRPPKPVHIGATAGYISKAYKTVEETTGITFGADYLWHINHPEESDWYPNSEKPAIALCIFKEIFPEKQIAFAADLQYSLHFEGRDLTDNEAYRHLLEKYEINETDFYEKLKSEEYKAKAYEEFDLCRRLQVNGFPQVFIQDSETKLYLVAQGYTVYEDVKKRIEMVLNKSKN
jgi:putative protein-disulfide isomerase